MAEIIGRAIHAGRLWYAEVARSAPRILIQKQEAALIGGTFLVFAILAVVS